MQSIPPRSDEFEISVFGPGRGECAVIHLGENEWCIVDSCVSRGSPDPIAVEYLDAFGNGALNGVQLIIATHWHDDHIGGMASLLAKSPNAAFCCSVALKKEEFVSLLASAPKTIVGRSGVDEFGGILQELEKRGRLAPKWAIENRPLLRLTDAGRSFPVELEALSPSDATTSFALQQIRTLLPKKGNAQRRIPPVTPNHASVVLWIKAGGIRVLLGADLENNSRSTMGWTAVMAAHSDSALASLFKIPHHGSENGHNDAVWAAMLDKDPIAVVTPFTRGDVRLPLDSDLDRLSKKTANLYCTSPGAGKPPTRDRAVERLMKSKTSYRKVLDGKAGHVRVRWRLSAAAPTPEIAIFSGAYKV